MKITHALVTLLALLAFNLPVHAEEIGCEKYLAKDFGQMLAEIREDFGHNTNYTVEVPVIAIQDQRRFGGCWVYATLADIESEIKLATGQNVVLSEQYIVAMSVAMRALSGLTNLGRLPSEGGDVFLAQKLIQKFGLVPKIAWEPAVPFEHGPHSERMMYFINSRIAEYQLGLGKLKTAKARKKSLETAQSDIQKIINTYFGEPPSEFTYRGEKYTPQTFAQKFYPAKDTELAAIYPKSPEMKGPLKKLADKLHPMSPRDKLEEDAQIEKSVAEIKEFIISRLKQGHAVPIGVEIVDAFVDNRTGIMSIGAFHTPPGFKVPSRDYRENFGLAGGGHMILVVGADLDAAGNLIKFKIKNSWGKKVGDDGYYHMYADYFDQFFGVTYRESHIAKP